MRLRGQRSRDLGAGGRHLVRRRVQGVVGVSVWQDIAVGNGGDVGGQMSFSPRTESTWHCARCVVVVRVRLQVQRLHFDGRIGQVVEWVLGGGRHHRDGLVLENRRGGGRHCGCGLHFDLVLAGFDEIGWLGAQVLWLIADLFWNG